MTTDEDYTILEKNLKVLKGKRIIMEYNDRILLDKVNPTPEEIMLTLYSEGED